MSPSLFFDFLLALSPRALPGHSLPLPFYSLIPGANRPWSLIQYGLHTSLLEVSLALLYGRICACCIWVEILGMGLGSAAYQPSETRYSLQGSVAACTEWAHAQRVSGAD